MSTPAMTHLEPVGASVADSPLRRILANPGRRYLVISAGLLVTYSVLFLLFVPGRTDDFWDHAAAVRAMTENFHTPAHPLFAGPYTGDRGFNPYLLSLAVLSRATGLSPFQVLKVGALLNLALLFAGVYLFVMRYFMTPGAAIWVLVSYLFFWTTRGAMVREWAYYPSFFVMSATFLFWYVLIRYLREGTRSLLCFTIAVGWVLWLSHQLQAGMAIGNGILLAYLGEDAPRARRWNVAWVLPILVIGLGELWPYFSSLKLLLQNFTQFGYKEPGRPMVEELRFYGYILGPNLLGIVLVILTKAPTKIERFLKVSTLLSGVAWAALFLVRSQYAGIVMGNIGNMAAMRVGLALMPATTGTGGPILPLWLPGDCWLRKGLIVVLSLAMLLQVKYTLGWFRQFYWTEEGARYREMVSGYGRLARYIGTRDVVLSDIWTSWQLPTFTGKVITRPEGHHLDYNVPRPEIRQRAVDAETFFQPDTPEVVRHSLVAKYGATYVLINKVQSIDLDQQIYERLGHVVFSDRNFTLILVRRG